MVQVPVEAVHQTTEPSTQLTLDGTADERLRRKLLKVRKDLVDSGIYIGEATNQFRDAIEWKRQARGVLLEFKDVDETNADFDDTVDSVVVGGLSAQSAVTPKSTPAVLSVVVMGSYDDCWLTPCGNWKGPTQVTKKFEDLKLSFLGERPSKVDTFCEDYTSVLTNVKWLMNGVVGDHKTKKKGFLTTSRMGNTETLKFRHVVFEVRFSIYC